MSHDTEELCKIWGFFVSKMTRTWWILIRALKRLKYLHFDWPLLCKVYNVWLRKAQRRCVSWHSRVMQNLKKNWLVVWKMTWGIWQIFIRTLESNKIGTFMGSFLSKVEMSWKFTEELCVMAMKNDEKSEEELSCRFKIDIRNLRNFDSRAGKVSKIYTLIGCFWPKYIMFELKKYRGVIFHETRVWCKIWRKTNL